MERVLAFKKVLKFELCLPPKKVSGTSALTWVSSGGQCHMEVLLPQQLNSMAAPWRDLATSGSRWYILRSLCVPKGGNQTSQGAILEAAFQTAPVISSMFTACFATHLNQSFWSLQGKKKKNKKPHLHRAFIMHRDRAAISLADWKVPEKNTSSISWTEGWHYSCGTWRAFSMVPKGPALLKSINSMAGN